VDEGEEMLFVSVLSRGDASEVFELVEAAFDAISCLVGCGVVGGWVFSFRFEGTTASMPGSAMKLRTALLS
jgi:hypothetical protein